MGRLCGRDHFFIFTRININIAIDPRNKLNLYHDDESSEDFEESKRIFLKVVYLFIYQSDWTWKQSEEVINQKVPWQQRTALLTFMIKSLDMVIVMTSKDSGYLQP